MISFKWLSELQGLKTTPETTPEGAGLAGSVTHHDLLAGNSRKRPGNSRGAYIIL